MAADEPDTLAHDERVLAQYADELADGIEAHLADWTVRSVQGACTRAGVRPDDQLHAEAVAAGERCRDEVAPQVRALLQRDVDDQRTGPLSLLRRAVVHPTAVLAAAGVPPVERDEFDRRVMPEDRYGLAPATFADLDESLAEPGLRWGAAKAHVHLARRRRTAGGGR